MLESEDVAFLGVSSKPILIWCWALWHVAGGSESLDNMTEKLRTRSWASAPQSQQLVTVPECGANHQMKTRAINPLHMPRGAECANGVIYFCLPQVIEHFPPQAWSILLLMAPDIVDSLLLSPD